MINNNLQQGSNHGVSVNPRFIFGVKGYIKNNVHFLDDHRVTYPAGHNIIIYCFDDKSQTYIPGIEGSDGITALTVSPSKRFLAVCEKAERALCVIYDLHGISHIPP